MLKTWTTDELLELAGDFKAACVLAAAAELDLFTCLADGPRSGPEIADLVGGDRRATTILLDALAALGLLTKAAAGYALAPGLAPALTAAGKDSILAMAQHQANCLRRWADLARVVRTGVPAARSPSVRGEAGDKASFIEAMNDVSRRSADTVIAGLASLPCTHWLDVGGASGTWTIALLRARPRARATLFDLPHVIPMARQRLESAGLLDRVRLVAGDFLADELPAGADLAWVSAIVHQNSRDQNRALFAKVHRALVPGGRIAIRDMVMEDSRTAPVAGALFAVNMLVGTAGGGTFTLAELREDLAAAGFADAALVHPDAGMNCVVAARRA